MVDKQLGVVHSAQLCYSLLTECKDLAPPLFVPGTAEKVREGADGTWEKCD